MDRHMFLLRAYVAVQQQMTKKFTIIAAKFENCCNFGQISSEKNVLNFGRELILQFMEVF